MMNESIKVLLVEDDEDDFILTRDLLAGNARTPFVLEWARNYETGLQAIQRRQHTVCLIDYRLGQHTGIELVEEARQRDCQMPLILLTGQGNADVDLQAMLAGATDYLVKGQFDGTALERVIRYALERQRAQAEIRETEARFRLIARATNDAVWEWNIQTHETWNSEGYIHFGYPLQEIENSFDWWFSKIHPDDQSGLMSGIEAVIKSRHETWHGEYRFRRKNGSWAHIYDRAFVLRDADGAAQRMVGAMMDISQRKQSEQALRQSEARFAKAFQSNPAAMGITTVKEGRLIEVNERYCQLFGYAREELIGQTIPKLGLWESAAARGELMERLLAQGSIHDFEVRFRRKNGEVRDVLVSLELIDFPGEHEPVYASMLLDITDRKRAEEKIREQAGLLDKAHDAIIVRDLDLRIVYWSKGAERMYGWTAGEACAPDSGRPPAKDDSTQFQEANRIALEKGEWIGELRQQTKSGGEIVVSSSRTLLRDDRGQPKAILAINTDITAKKLLEAQFLRSQRMDSIGALAGGIAHDLNNALAPIVMATELLKMTNKDPDKGRILDTIFDSAQRGAGMVKQILTFARGNEGERGTVQVKHLLREITDLAQHTFPKAVRIHTDIAKDIWQLVGHPTQLHQILLNLCVNARDAMPKGGTLTLAASNVRLDARSAELPEEAEPGPYVLLTVSDTGTGMPPEVRARIFDPFFTTKAPDKGTGLGLSTVQKIVKDHGGILTVHSEVGRGTTFKVHLPAQESDVSQLDGVARSLPMGKGELILVVDDEAAIRGVASQTLKAFGYKVLDATDGAQAVALCARHLNELQMVITDMNMPIMDGRATVTAVRSLLPKVKIIAASGSGLLSTSCDPAGLGSHAVLQKPYSADILVRTVHEVLNGEK